MAATTRQTSLLVNQDWTKVYESFRNADFQSFDFQTIRKSMIDYLKLYYPEDFNDFVESSEYIALIDMIAFMGQSLAFRTDLNARENFIDTAERRDSVLKLAKLISYVPKRNQPATGFIKFESVQTSESITDSYGIDLSNLVIRWNDSTNINWYEQFVTILNAALPVNQVVGKPANKQTIGGIVNEEYSINLTPGTLPVFRYNTEVESVNLPFEVVSATSAAQSYIYEVAPRPGAPLNILYKNDSQGNASNNTGFFFYFKQGTLAEQTFSVNESIPNNVVALNVDNINNSDVWLYQLSNSGTIFEQWNQVPNVNGVNIIYNNNAPKKSYQVTSRNNDQINLVFGDGTFAAMPQGPFKCYYRTSAGVSYKITPDEMQNITITIPYVSRSGSLQTLVVVASLKYTVANALSRESLAEIKTKAPQQYYTQNRMVTAEDYNTFPYSNFSSISKVKSVNRTSSGISRFLDVVDTTGRYSSTNIFADDGILYKEDTASSFDFTWGTTSDINRVILNQVLPTVRGKPLLHFYYQYFTRFGLTDLYWYKVTTESGASTGYFVNSAGTAQQIGRTVTGNNAYLNPNCIIIFSPGTGNYFDAQNEIKPLPSNGLLPANGNLLLYVTMVNLIGNGSQGTLSTGTGPVTLSMNIPSGAQALTVIPAFSNSFTTVFTAELIRLISSYTEFGVTYNQYTGLWEIITAQDIDLTSEFSLTYQGDTTGQSRDASWVMAFTVNGTIYNVQTRGLTYTFESATETKFYFDESVKVFDPITGLTLNDSVNVLKVNGDPDTREPLDQNILWYIYGQTAESDGYIDNSKVLVTYSDVDDDGVPDNPDIFNTVVQPTVNPDSKYVYFVKTYGYNNFVTYEPVDNADVESDYATQFSILPNVNEYPVGQIFYATEEEKFYVSSENALGVITITVTNDYLAYTGRQNLYFQYRHNAPGNRRIDPSPNNLIDMYILTKEYESEYRAWALDTTGKVSEPERPAGETLRLQYASLESYKTVSDAIIYNSAKFKPLFGAKAKDELQATFKVIKNSNVNISDSEIRSQVLAYINSFFATANWDFGDTFYFTELATYIQQSMAPNISSIVIVPNSASQVYGSLQQIGSEPDEILISVATVENIEVIASITASQLNLQNSTINTLIN